MDGNRVRVWAGMFLLVSLAGGCVGIPTQLMWVLYGQKVAAEFNGLEGKTVAVVCVSDASAYGPTNLTYTVERQISERLKTNVKKVVVIPQTKVNDWKDNNAWNEENFYQLGKGVEADVVLAIEVSNYSLYDGQTMYKGRATVASTVYDMEKGDVVFRRGPEEYTFPKSGRPSIQNNDRQFEEYYLTKLCEHLARRFYEFDKKEMFAEDAGG